MSLKLGSGRNRAASRPGIQKRNRQKALAVAAVAALAGAGAAALVHFRPQFRSFARSLLAYSAALQKPRRFPKTAVARVTENGRPAGFLAPGGRLFQAPDALYPQDVPRVDIGGLDQAGLPALADFLDKISRLGGEFSPLVRLSYVSPQDGWTAVFANGVQAEWGDFRWTELKLERMRQVLDDAKPDLNGPANLDLRYFAGGRIILRPGAMKSVSMR